MKETGFNSNPAPNPVGSGRTQYLVTGAHGFVGREISAQLRAQGYPVRGLVLREKPEVPMPRGMELVKGDLLQPDSLDPLFAGIDPRSAVLIHTAAHISVRKHNPRCERVNQTGTENLLAACRRHGVRRFVHFGSVDALPPSADGSPITEPERFMTDGLLTSYDRSKAASAQRVLDAVSEGLDCTLLLPAAIVGPGDYRNGFITRMIGLYLSGFSRLNINGGYDFVDVRDVASAAIAVSKRSGNGDCYILSNRYADVAEVFHTLAAHTGRKPARRAIPPWLLVLIAPLVSAACIVTGREPPLTLSAVRLMRTHPAYCHDKADRELDFSPRSLAQSLKDTADFILARRERSKR